MLNQPALAEHFSTHALDLPGHGGSTLEVRDGAVPQLAADVLSLLDALEIAAAHFVGHSLGGAISLFLALLTLIFIFRPRRVWSHFCPRVLYSNNLSEAGAGVRNGTSSGLVIRFLSGLRWVCNRSTLLIYS